MFRLPTSDSELSLTRTQSHIPPPTQERVEPEHLSLDTNGDSDATISILNLVELVQELGIEYKDLKGAPKEVQDALLDVGYLGDSLGYLETLFGDGKRGELKLPVVAIQTLTKIKTPLLTELQNLVSTLKVFPKPPSLWTNVTFNLQHTTEVKTFRQQLSEHQLALTVFLSEATFLPPQSLEEPISPTQPARVEVTVTCPDSDSKGKVDEGVVIEHEEEREVREVLSRLSEMLRVLPCTLRLRHLNEQLGGVVTLANEGNDGMKSFAGDVKGILGLCKGLDGRLLDHHEEFAQDVMRELHTIIDLEVKMLLHELRLMPPLILSGLFLPSSATIPSPPTTTTQITYTSLPIPQFLLDHRAILMMIQCLVAGSRMSGRDPRHQGGTLRHEGFEEAGAAVLERLAGHSGGVNSWCEVRRHFG